MAKTSRERLISAAKDLLWERGYDAMSPRDVLNASGTGQGSLYHFFSGKAELASAAMKEIEADLCQVDDAILQSDQPPLERIKAYLLRPRKDLRGCRLGRLAADVEVIKHDELRQPIADYFTRLQDELAQVIAEAQAAGDLRGTIAAADLATMLISIIQGGYVLTRAMQDLTKIESAVNTAVALLESFRP